MGSEISGVKEHQKGPENLLERTKALHGEHDEKLLQQRFACKNVPKLVQY